MTKIFLLLIAILAVHYNTTAQWSQNSSILFTTNSVGIGAAIPEEKLEVDGFIKAGFVSFGQYGTRAAKNYINLGADNHGSLILGSNLYVDASGTASTLQIARSHTTMSGAGIFIPGNLQANQNSIIFHTAEPGSAISETVYSNPRMIISSGGNVGIGTVNPTEKLSVKGNIRAIGIKVEANSGTNWPDYVFNKDYKLPSLSDVEKHVKEKGHLPEVPSAKEVEKNGFELGSNQVVLLKKIEELTLYMIELNKTVSDLQNKISQLEKSKPIK